MIRKLIICLQICDLMYVKKADEIKKEIVEIADKTEIQWLIGEDTGKEFFMRKFTMKPGGSMPKHYHNNYHHEQYVLKGKLRIGLNDEVFEVGPGHVIYIPENVAHWYESIGDEDAEFLCLIPKRKEYHMEIVK